MRELYGRNIYKKSADRGSGGVVDFVDLLLRFTDSMARLRADYDQSARKHALSLGQGCYLGGNSYYLVVGNGGL